MRARVEAEEVQQTTSEKTLAVVLGAFILIGLVWGYVKLAEVDRPDNPFGPHFAQPEQELLDPQSQEALKTERAARRELAEARRAEEAATEDLTLRREAYRTALDAGEPASDLREAYLAAQDRLAAAEARVEQASDALAAARPAADAAQEELRQAERAQVEEARESEEDHDRTVLLLRLGLIIGMAACALVLLARLRARRSRYLPLALAWLTASALMGVVLAADYSWGSIDDFSGLGPLLLAVAGTAMTVAGFVALERHLAGRTPIRRVRRKECPFCGFPTEGPHCEGCGRRVIGECAHCHAPRRVGTPHCSACGRS